MMEPSNIYSLARARTQESIERVNKKRKVKRTAPLKGQKFGPMMGRGFGLHVLPFTLNDEMDDVSDCAKNAAKKLMEAK